ncbi:hypothetical protein Metho_1480 [Methanomethylovorans hollandica DSM 15978]|uniref:Uncharacterized protein n=1 Tax=Methanomethylovorans hollandica (strain DSM 15978 / NBRC 107637 / DMS1) TaxID=867904 RepID=L0KYB7_METHD|nr:hypothetical protein Metho_1480 [Methanomethylovorans hollandica DSM 15978]
MLKSHSIDDDVNNISFKQMVNNTIIIKYTHLSIIVKLCGYYLNLFSVKLIDLLLINNYFLIVCLLYSNRIMDFLDSSAFMPVYSSHGIFFILGNSCQ